MMERGIVHCVQWCDTRDMTADGHTKGSIDRALIYQVMDGRQAFKDVLKKHVPFRAGRTSKDESEPPDMERSAGVPAERSAGFLVYIALLAATFPVVT